jgi:hypothetical protein
MNLLKKFNNWWNAPKRAPISIGNIKAVIQSFFRRRRELPNHIKEQIINRIELSNPRCKETNVCVCGCDWSDLIYADKSCENNCYPEMMDKKSWKKYKNDKGKSQNRNIGYTYQV